MKSLLKIFGLAGLLVLVAIAFGHGSASAETANFALGCDPGSQLTIVDFGNYKVAKCSGGTSTFLPQEKAGETQFNLTIVCPAGSGATESEQGSDAARQFLWTCNDGSLPTVNQSGGGVTGGPSGTGGGTKCGSTSVAINVGCDSSNDNPIYVYLRAIIKFMSGAIGLAVVLMIIVSGIQYMTSAGNPAAVAAAKSRLFNAVLGLLLFVLMFGILNALIPGGVLK